MCAAGIIMDRTDLALPPGLYGNREQDKQWQWNQGRLGEGVIPCWAFSRSSANMLIGEDTRGWGILPLL